MILSSLAFLLLAAVAACSATRVRPSASRCCDSVIMILNMMMMINASHSLSSPSQMQPCSSPFVTGYSRPMRVCDNCHSSIATGIPFGGGSLGESKSPMLQLPSSSPDKVQHHAAASNATTIDGATIPKSTMLYSPLRVPYRDLDQAP